MMQFPPPRGARFLSNHVPTMSKFLDMQMFPQMDMVSPHFYPHTPTTRASPPQFLSSTSYKSPPTQSLPIRVIGDVNVKDLVRGRFVGSGGAIRFYLLAKQIKHTFSAIDDATWAGQKYQLAQVTQMPFPELPILTHNGVGYYGSSATLRYLTKKMGEYGSDVRKDFVSDYVTSRLEPWRVHLDQAVETLLNSKPDSTLFDYLSRRSAFYDEFETMLRHFTLTDGSAFFTGNNPVMCDVFLFAILYDDQILVETLHAEHAPSPLNQHGDMLDVHGCLKALYDKLAGHPNISEFIMPKDNPDSSSSGQSPRSRRQPIETLNYGEMSEEAVAYSSMLSRNLEQPTPFFPPPRPFELGHAGGSMMTTMRNTNSYEPPPMMMPWQQHEASSYSYTPPPMQFNPPNMNRPTNLVPDMANAWQSDAPHYMRPPAPPCQQLSNRAGSQPLYHHPPHINMGGNTFSPVVPSPAVKLGQAQFPPQPLGEPAPGGSSSDMPPYEGEEYEGIQ